MVSNSDKLGGRVRGNAVKMALHVGGAQARRQCIGGFIIAREAEQLRVRAERGDIERDVAAATGAVLDFFDLHYRYGRFGRDARCAAVPVAIEHDIADDEDASVIETGHVGHKWESSAGSLR